MEVLYVALFVFVIFKDAFFLVEPKPKREEGLKIIFYIL